MAVAAKRDYYQVLGVPRGVDAETLKKAYRSLARELHPDVSEDPEAEEKFTEVTEAYSVLSRSTTRMLYDHFGYRGRGQGWFNDDGPGSAGDLLSLFLAGRGRSADAVAEVEVDADEAARGTSRTVRFTSSELCSGCGGVGAAPGAYARTCPGCDGSGRRRRSTPVPGVRLLQVEDCDQCQGRGRLVSEPCPQCDAVGRISSAQTARVKIPAGIRNGALVPLDDDGSAVVVRVVRARDSLLARGVALLGLFVALGFLVYLLLGR